MPARPNATTVLWRRGDYQGLWEQAGDCWRARFKLLIRASSEGNFDACRYFVNNRGLPVNHHKVWDMPGAPKFKVMYSPFACALRGRHFELAKWLFARDPQYARETVERVVAHGFARLIGPDIDVVQWMLSNNVTLMHSDRRINNPVVQCIQEEPSNYYFFQFLLVRLGAQCWEPSRNYRAVNVSLVVTIFARGDIRAMKMLQSAVRKQRQQNPQIPQPVTYNVAWAKERQPFYHAIRFNQMHFIGYLLNAPGLLHRYFVEGAVQTGNMLMRWALELRQRDVIEGLLDRGFNPYAPHAASVLGDDIPAWLLQWVLQWPRIVPLQLLIRRQIARHPEHYPDMDHVPPGLLAWGGGPPMGALNRYESVRQR